MPPERRTAERRRRQDALRPHARARSPNTCRGSSPSTACRSSAAVAARRPSTSPRRRRGPAARARGQRHAGARARRGVDLLLDARTSRTDRCCSSASAPTRTGRRSSVTRCSRGDWDTCVGIGRDQIKEGAHILDVCVDYTGADGVADMNELMSRLATQSSVPIMVDTTETKVARQALTWLGGKALLNSREPRRGRRTGHPPRRLPRLAGGVRRGHRRHVHRRGGSGAHRGVEGARGARDHRPRRRALRTRRRTTSSSTPWRCRSRPAWSSRGATASRRSRRFGGSRPNCPACARSSGSPTSPSASTPARARPSTASSCTSAPDAGLDAAIVHASKLLPLNRSTKRPAASASTSSTTDAARTTTRSPCCSGCTRASRTSNAATSSLDELELNDRLRRRIIDGARVGLESDLDEAMAEGMAPLDIVNDLLLDGMREVGDLFASGEMQLPSSCRAPRP